MVTKTSKGYEAENQALAYLIKQGLYLLKRNYRVARGPSAYGGEIDLIMRAPDQTIVFVEVRARASEQFGGALSSITATKQRRCIYAAQCYLQRFQALPPCRFDVVSVDALGQIHWVPGAFSAVDLT